jgi:hypothetical protein
LEDGVDAAGEVAVKRRLRRAKVGAFTLPCRHGSLRHGGDLPAKPEISTVSPEAQTAASCFRSATYPFRCLTC